MNYTIYLNIIGSLLVFLIWNDIPFVLTAFFVLILQNDLPHYLTGSQVNIKNILIFVCRLDGKSAPIFMYVQQNSSYSHELLKTR